MEKLELKKIIQNYKKMQLYSTDTISIECSIINDLQRDLEEYAGKVLGNEEKRDMIAKVITYMEFGFCYDANKALMEKVLKVCDIERKEISNLADKDAQYIKATKANIQKIIIWKNHSSSISYMNKGDVVADILSRIKDNRQGIYSYTTDCCRYELIIETDMIILKNVVKGIKYYLL